MPELRQLHRQDGPAVLDFERANRSYFASFIADRGDEFFDEFAEQFDALLAEQEAGSSAFYVLVDDDGALLGRFNLYDLEGGAARLGYRVAEHIAGRGVATAAVQELCVEAAELGLHTLMAATSHENVASQKVLLKAGFVATGAADRSELGGKSGTRYRRDLAAG